MAIRKPEENLFLLRMQLILFLLLIAVAGVIGVAIGARRAVAEPVWPLVMGLLGLLAFALVWLHQGVLRPWQQLLEKSQQQSERTAEHEEPRVYLSASGLGVWDWDVLRDHAVWSELISEAPGATLQSTLEGFIASAAPEDQPALRAALDASFRQDSVQVAFRTRASEPRWLECTGRVFRDPQGKPVRMLGTLRDVTMRHREIQTLRTAADTAILAHDQFLAKIGHKLRSSLSEIIGISELLHDTQPSAEQLDYLQTLKLSAEKMLSVLEAMSEQQTQPTTVIEPPPESEAVQTARPLSILLAEDTPLNQQVLTLMLEKAGHHISLARNGREALEAMEREKFDLILMDVQMPEMDGLRATRLIRAREKAVGGRVPVVAVTANAGQGERERCLAAGMDEYLAKPIRGHELLTVLARLAGSAVSLVRRPEEKAPAIDWLQALQSMGLDEEAILRLVRTFLETAPGRLERMRNALAQGDAAEVYATAHTLKSSLAVFAARSASDAARRLEEMGREQHLDGASEPLAQLESGMAVLLDAMKAFLQNAA